MKRQREEIINDINGTKRLMNEYLAAIKREEANLENYVIELENFKIDQHKQATIKQFEIWKMEFCEKYKDNQVKKILDTYVLLEWDVQCLFSYTRYSPNVMRKIYSNKVSILLNYDLFIEFSVDRTNYFPNVNEFIIWHIDDAVIDLYKIKSIESLNSIASKLGISSGSLFDIVALFYHAFMFDPRYLNSKYTPNEEPKIIYDMTRRFGTSRCYNYPHSDSNIIFAKLYL